MKLSEKIKQMSNEELRIKVAELLGFTDIAWMEIPVPWLMDLVEENWTGVLDGDRVCLPDWPNYIAAAMSLEPKDRRREYGDALIDVLGFTFCDMLTWETAMDIAFASPRDRTMAFIMAMEGEK